MQARSADWREGGRPSHVICTAYRRCQTSDDDGGEISNCNRGRHEPRAARWHSKVMPPPISNMYSAKTTREAKCARGEAAAGGAGEGQLQNRHGTDFGTLLFTDAATYLCEAAMIHVFRSGQTTYPSFQNRNSQIASKSWLKLVPLDLNLVSPEIFQVGEMQKSNP